MSEHDNGGPALNYLRGLWCSWTHGGGDIRRDASGRINWQCRKCGRWSTPVEHAEEAAAICAETGQHKDPYGCWNVRCQLGKQCCRHAQEDRSNA